MDFVDNEFFFEEDFYKPIEFENFYNDNLFRLSTKRVTGKASSRATRFNKTQAGNLLHTFGAIKRLASNNFLKSKKHQQDIVIQGHHYKIGELMLQKNYRRQTNFLGGAKGLNNTISKPQEGVLPMKKTGTAVRMENRKNDIIAKIIQSSNENSPEKSHQKLDESIVQSEDVEQEEEKSPSPTGGFFETFKQTPAQDNESSEDLSIDDAKCERRMNKEILIRNLESHKPKQKHQNNEEIMKEIRDSHRHRSDPTKQTEKGVKLMRKSTLKLIKENKKQYANLESLFNDKFKAAVKITRSDSSNTSEIKFFKKLISETKNVTKQHVKKKELEMLSKFATGYSYAVDVDEDKFLKTNSVKKLTSDEVLYEQILSECKDIQRPKMSKVFTFTKADYDKVTNDEEDITTEEVKQLLDLIKFSNAKQQQKLQNFKHKHFEAIRDLNDRDVYKTIEKMEEKYEETDFQDFSLDLIVRDKAQKRLKGDREVDEIYQFKVTRQISVDYTGIV